MGRILSARLPTGGSCGLRPCLRLMRHDLNPIALPTLVGSALRCPGLAYSWRGFVAGFLLLRNLARRGRG